MNNDRELLELAAKAAGVNPMEFTYNDEFQWNPLGNDGDALRLAVKLKIDLHFGEFGVYANNALEDTYQLADDYTAETTRRAIVRAAAEIGKAMK